MDERGILQRVLDLAAANVRDGQRPFGAIVVAGGRVVAEGVNTVTSSGDPTDHAEVRAIRAASQAVGGEDLSGAIVYTSCEPCIMCQATGLFSGVERMVFAASSALAADMGFPAPSRAARVQERLRSELPGYVVAGDIPPAVSRVPFAVWIERHDEDRRA
ncbi:nucleoside deaminase [Microbacterium sp. Root180]|uniref:nucleoside deaminase n=1 Tax=Microbacterium sp. Root180 TaxID=1736483 RepID=UPI002286B3F0|nr:nucleoside deaminase [Microbacterium sp. Root180]